MIGDLREVEDGAQLEADLCIVGAGARWNRDRP